MTPRQIRAGLLAVIVGVSVSAFAQTPVEPAAQPAPGSPRNVSSLNAVNPDEKAQPLKLNDGTLELVLPIIEQLTGRDIIRPQGLPAAQITINIKDGMTKGEALRAFETALNLNGIGLVRMGDRFLKVIALQNIRLESPQMIEGSSLDLPPSGQIVSKLFQLQFLRVQEFVQQMANISANVSPPVFFERSNAVLITDSLTNIQRIEYLLKRVDQPSMANLVPKFYTIQFAKASDVVTKLRSLLQSQPQVGTSANYLPDDRTNQVILIADPRQHAFFDELIAKLDVKSDPNTRNEVIYLKHATAKEVASLLSSIVSNQSKVSQNSGSIAPGTIVQPGQGQPTPPPAAPISPAVASVLGDAGSTQFSSLASVFADDRSNAIVANGTMDDIRLIKDLVDKIDIVLAQVRIEVVITEVSLGDSASTGISALGLDVAGNKLMGISGTTPGMSVSANPSSQGYYGTTADNAAHGGPYGLTQAATGVMGSAATAGHFSLVGLVSLSTTPRKNYARILSVPTITTTHNKKSTFFFGETRPVINSITSNTAASNAQGYNTSAVQQQEIGTTVNVLPRIGNDGSVQLDIQQVISEVTAEVEIQGIKQYVIGTRKLDTFNTVKSGEIIVLGGMQKDNNSKSSSRLGPIPWIGDLLGSRSRSRTRTELVIFLRPTVLTNTPADNEEAMKTIESMPDADAVKAKLDPKYVPPKTPFYQKHMQIP
ncbi:MAG: secretin N-terminal domain-containing protein [Nibricoccus sp.]